MKRRRRTLAAIVAAGVGAVALLAGAPLLHGRTEAAPPAPAVRLAGRPAEAVQTIPAGRLLFIGASYSIGLGATASSASYPSLLASQLHRSYSVDAVSGTGFQNPGRNHSGTFAERLTHVRTTPAPRIVIIQGGRDDWHYPISREYAAALHTIVLAQQRFTAAQVVVLGPIPASLPVSAQVEAIRGALARACTAAHAGFVDPITLHWITPANVHVFSGHIRGHPNNAGYAYITSKLQAALPGALHGARPPLQSTAMNRRSTAT